MDGCAGALAEDQVDPSPVSGPDGVSAIICTKDRCGPLRATLEAFAALDLAGVPGFELIVIDNNSSDATQEVVAEFARGAPFRVIYRLERRRGGSAGKNLGFATASGDLIMITDDDCIIAPDWVQVARRTFRDDQLKIAGGRIELQDKAALPISIKTDGERQELASVTKLFGFMHGANMVFGRCVVERIGKFDVRMGPGTTLKAAEDTEFVYRAFRAGIPVVYEPDLVVHHDHGRSGAKTWYRMTRGYARGSGAMMMKHLLHGQTDLAKILYWDIRAAVRDWRRGAQEWRDVAEKASIFGGALRFLYASSWRQAE